jgi:hypothetical protein
MVVPRQRRPDQQPLGSTVAGVHQEDAAADDLAVLTVTAEHQLAPRSGYSIEHVHGVSRSPS